MKMRVVGFDDFLTRCQICVLSTGDVTVLIPELEKDEQLWDPLHVFKSMGECKRFIVELATPMILARHGHGVGVHRSLPIGSTYYMLRNGRRISENDPFPPEGELPLILTLVGRLVGGKGAFGSMLRSIGAQIEKTTSRDACRDLTGRRLRDIDEQRKVQKWKDDSANREEKKAQAKKDKLARLKAIADGPALPKITDQTFLKQRVDIEESLHDAVNQGFAAKEDEEEESGKLEMSTSTMTLDINLVQTSKSSSESAGISGSTVDEAQTDTSKSAAGLVVPEKQMKKTIMDEDFDEVSSDSGTSHSEGELENEEGSPVTKKMKFK